MALVEVKPPGAADPGAASGAPADDEAVVVRFRSDVVVELVRAAAADADVASAARVSTVGERSREVPDAAALAGLITFLMRERHGTPFEHSTFTFYVKAPIFVWREHMRHRIASYNEESARYRVLEPEFYLPGADRDLVQVGKAGAYTYQPGTPAQQALVAEGFRSVCTHAYGQYQRMLAGGVAREIARGVLPVTIYSRAYVTMNARALMNFLSLRRRDDRSHFPSYPQREIELVAEAYETHFAQHMPLSHAAFLACGRVCP